MIVSYGQKFVYIGINKTGTTSIEAILRPYATRPLMKYLQIKHKIWVQHRLWGRKKGFKHMPAAMARRLLGPQVWDRYFTFTFVRNPWARTVSEYTRHRHDPSVDVREGFEQWVMADGNWLARHNTMANFVTDESGKVMVDRVYKIEETSFSAVCNDIGIEPVELPKLNASRTKIGYREMYSAKTREIVDEWVRDDAAMFGYEF